MKCLKTFHCVVPILNFATAGVKCIKDYFLFIFKSAYFARIKKALADI